MLMSQVGLVIIGRNEGERLRRCLASVGAGGCDVVYVDSGSTDGSSEVARSRAAFRSSRPGQRRSSYRRQRQTGLGNTPYYNPRESSRPAKISFPSCLNAFVPLCVGLRAMRAPYYNPRESSRPAKTSFPSCLNAFVPLCVGLRATRGVPVSWAFHVKIERRFLNSPGLAFLVRKAAGGQDK
jgi:glycosyltransferase involved in cell wall biosynthesis